MRLCPTSADTVEHPESGDSDCQTTHQDGCRRVKLRTMADNRRLRLISDVGDPEGELPSSQVSGSLPSWLSSSSTSSTAGVGT